MSRPKKTTILFDAQPLLGSKTGVGYYTLGLITNLARKYSDEFEFVGHYYNFLGRKQIKGLPAAPNIRYRSVSWIPGRAVYMLNRLGVMLPIELLTRMRADFILYPNFWGQPSLLNTPNANVIHDLSYIDVAEFVSDKNARDLTHFVPHTTKRASFVIAVSEFSKRRTSDTYHVAPDSILTTYIPASKPRDISTIKTKLPIKKPFILFVGTLEPRKNLVTLLDAYTKLPEKIRRSHTLVLAGKMDWKYEATAAKLKELIDTGYDVKYLGYVDEDTRALLYARADCFILPAFYEGFGMPILEALSYDTPVCASDIPVFHEIAGDYITYFDPHDPVAMAKAISDTITSGKSDKKPQTRALIVNWDDICADVHERIIASLKS